MKIKNLEPSIKLIALYCAKNETDKGYINSQSKILEDTYLVDAFSWENTGKVFDDWSEINEDGRYVKEAIKNIKCIFKKILIKNEINI